MYDQISRDTYGNASGTVGTTAPSSRETTNRAQRASVARQASGRRRRIDPTTCERDYSAEELEFMTAMQDYKHRSGRMFPTWSEVLEVLQSLGYSRDSAELEDEALESAAVGGSASRRSGAC